MLKKQNMKEPTAIILSSALEFIEKEIRSCDKNLETGGLLLGTKHSDGSRLVTHATPPGPAAIHGPEMFERDLEFSQAILNYFAQQTGIEYLGEWHKHPPNYPRPSSGDLQGVSDILRDRDYRTEGMMLFPIFIIVPANSPLIDETKQSSDIILSTYSGNTDEQTVLCRPFYMFEGDTEFSLLTMTVANCNLGTQERIQQFHDLYSVVKGHKRGNPVELGEALGFKKTEQVRESIIRETSESNSNEAKDEKGEAKDHDTVLDIRENNGSNGANLDTLPRPVDFVEGGSLEKQSQWYESTAGKKLLASEESELRLLSNYLGAHRLKNGRIAFRFSRVLDNIEYVDVVCKSNHPTSVPEFFIKGPATIGPSHTETSVVVKLPSKEFSNLALLSAMVEAFAQEWDESRHPDIAEMVKTMCDESYKETDSPIGDQRSGEFQWYQALAGKERLVKEERSLQESGLQYSFKILEDKRLSIEIDSFIVKGEQYRLLTVFLFDHPRRMPQIYCERQGRWDTIKTEDVQSTDGTVPLLVTILASNFS